MCIPAPCQHLFLPHQGSWETFQHVAERDFLVQLLKPSPRFLVRYSLFLFCNSMQLCTGKAFSYYCKMILHSGASVSLCVCMLSHFSHVQLCDHMDCSPPGFSVHGILQARRLERVGISFSTASLHHYANPCISHTEVCM